MFFGLPDLTGSAFAGNDDGAHAERMQGVIDAFLSVAAVGGHGARCASGAGDDPLDGGRKLRRVCRIALLDGVVEHDAADVVNELGLVPELDRLTEAALGDRASIRIVQADLPRCSVRGDTGHPLPGLGNDPPGRAEQFGQVVDRASEPSTPPSRSRVVLTAPAQPFGCGPCAAQRPFRVDQQPFGVFGGGDRQFGEFSGDPLHRGLRLITSGR